MCGYYKGAGKGTCLFVYMQYENEKMFLREYKTLLFLELLSDRHDDITKDILEMDPWENRWTVVARHILMHDNYDVCLVANLNPRGLMSPPADLVKV